MDGRNDNDRKHTSMVHSISPSLAIRLGSLNRAHIVGFSVVIPCEDLNNIKLVSGANQGFPSFCVEVLVGKEDELKGISIE